MLCLSQIIGPKIPTTKTRRPHCRACLRLADIVCPRHADTGCSIPVAAAPGPAGSGSMPAMTSRGTGAGLLPRPDQVSGMDAYLEQINFGTFADHSMNAL